MTAATKTCTTCMITKPIEQFSLARNGTKQQKPVRKSKCKVCQSAAAKAWFAENRERSRETKRRFALKKYGFTPEEYDALLEEQGGVCAICGEEETAVDGRTGLVFLMPVDHCHATGRTRGILCHACNRALGLFGDSIDRLRKAIDYLERT